MRKYHKITALFLPKLLPVKPVELLRSPRKYATLIGLALLGDVTVASALPLGVLMVLLATRIIDGIPTPLIGIAIVVIVFFQKLEQLDRLSSVHSVLLCGGTLYVFNNGKEICAATSATGATNAPELTPHERTNRRVNAVKVPGLAFWTTPMMREVMPTHCWVETPLDLHKL